MQKAPIRNRLITKRFINIAYALFFVSIRTPLTHRSFSNRKYQGNSIHYWSQEMDFNFPDLISRYKDERESPVRSLTLVSLCNDGVAWHSNH